MQRKISKNSKYKQGDIYRHNGNEFYKVNDVRDLEYDNKSFRQYIKDLHKLVKSFKHLEERINNHKDNIKEFLENVTNTNQDGDLESLISLLDSLLVINKHTNYDLFNFDDDGYINSINNINGIILERIDMPDDILKGYYTIINNEITKDEERCIQLYNQL